MEHDAPSSVWANHLWEQDPVFLHELADDVLAGGCTVGGGVILSVPHKLELLLRDQVLIG